MPVNTDDLRNAIPSLYPDNLTGQIDAARMREGQRFVADVIDEAIGKTYSDEALASAAIATGAAAEAERDARFDSMADILADPTLSGGYPVDTILAAKTAEVVKVVTTGETSTLAGGVKVAAQPVRGAVTGRSLGVKGDGVADDTTALNGAMNYAGLNGYKLILDGRMMISDTVTFRTRNGRGVSDTYDAWPETARLEMTGNSKFIMTASNKRALVFQGRGIRCDYAAVEYQTAQTASDTDSYGIAFRDVSAGVFGKLFSSKAAKGVATDFDSGANDFFFDNTIDQMWVYQFASVGVSIRPRNEGNTPNRIGQIIVRSPTMDGSMTNGILRGSGATTYCQPGIDVAVRLKGSAGTVVDNIVLESFGINTSALDIEDCTDAKIGTIHFEAVMATANDARFINVKDSNVNIGGISLYDTDSGGIQSRTLVNIINIADVGGYADIGAVHFSGLHYVGPSTRLVKGPTVGCASIGKYVDEIGLGTAFVSAKGRPIEDRSGFSGPSGPVTTYFNGAPLLPAVATQGTGGTTATTATPIDLPEVDDPYEMHSSGIVTIPKGGFYIVNIRGRADTGTAQIKVNRKRSGVDQNMGAITVNTSDVITCSPLLKLDVGDQISMQLNSGTLSTANTCGFSVAMISA